VIAVNIYVATSSSLYCTLFVYTTYVCFLCSFPFDYNNKIVVRGNK
jgi:hypothetical protein